MGEVYKARDVRLGREVALKVLPAALAADPARRARFETEARAASALNHPGILTVFDVGSENGLAYLVTEFIDGQTLRHARPKTLRRQLDAAAQIAEALAAAHAGGITHRDLKPENVMLTRDGRVKVLDFGLARHASVAAEDSTLTNLHTQPGAVLGTIGYMSPEQARGQRADYRSDIFSFGALLYELLTGQRAFSGDSAADTLSAILNQDLVELPEEIPAGVGQIVQHCLEKDPNHRFQSAKDLAFALRAMSGSSLTAPAVTDVTARRARNPLWFAAPIITVAVGFAVHAWLFSPSYMDLASHRYTPLALDLGGPGSLPEHAWAPDGKSFVYQAPDISGRQQLFIRSLDSPAALQLTNQPWSAAYPVYSADGSRIYYLGQEKSSREIWSVSTAGGTPERLAPSLGGSPFLDGLVVSRDGKALLFMKLEDGGKLPMSLWISSPPGAPARKYPGAPSARVRPYNRARLRFSPDGSHLLAMVSENGPYQFWLLPWPPKDAGRSGVRRILPEIRDWVGISSADWMPDGRHLILSRIQRNGTAGPLWVADVATGKLDLLSGITGEYSSPVVNSRDGRILITQARTIESIVEIPLDGSPPRDLLATSRRQLDPAWSPIGEQLVYVTNARGDDEIWLMSRKEGWRRPLVTQGDLPLGNKYSFVQPVWSPDGSRIAYGDGRGEIWVSPLAGGPATPVLPKGIFGDNPTWSPDGSWIAFSQFLDNRSYLNKQKVGSNAPPIRIAEAASGEIRFRTAWSPDGKWITIQFPEGFGVISPDGKNRKVILRGRLGLGSACGWSRDSSRLYLAYLKSQNLILSAFDIRTGAERTIVDLGEKRFSYLSTNSALLSEAPDGKSLAGSFWTDSAEIWMIEGVKPPPDFWRRLFWRPDR